MSRYDELDAIIDEENGYLLTSQAVARGISKPTVACYVEYRSMERVGHGLYRATDAWEDELFELSATSTRPVFSHETSLHLHGLMEREPVRPCMTVAAGYNATRLRGQGVKVFQVRAEAYGAGITSLETPYGHVVRAYDMDRTICDIVRRKDKMDPQVFRFALREYMGGSEKNLSNLMAYARLLHVEPLVRTYTEVML